eukprot:gnl/TRDRNA2_/TRDRNA2_114565_c1_seq1.p1 gnl/TRDRNA2_/TRDRNA2_114565_c1~~gnl/TRDRNA2_/TRDRNA2_114565_c1_seq1.p1  ORF type:complete len:744 (-),score=13.17 gnl/TRDRNA2_/TRDRNA2_114565_c1_seq1:11-2182(-)
MLLSAVRAHGSKRHVHVRCIILLVILCSRYSASDSIVAAPDSVPVAPTCYTTAGEVCTFPFIFNDTSYNECTSASWTSPWCGTFIVVTAGSSMGWGECTSSCPGYTAALVPATPTLIPATPTLIPATPTCYTTSSVACVFPFTFNGVVYNGCTRESWTSPWCGTSAIVIAGSSTDWGECTSSCPESASAAAPVSLFPTAVSVSPTCYTQGLVACVFPFVFADKIHNSCTSESWTSSWCGTTSVVTADSPTGWGECSSGCPGYVVPTIPVSGAPASCATTDLVPCSFPFVFDGVVYNMCTALSWTASWCGTMSVVTTGPAAGPKVGWGECMDTCPGYMSPAEIQVMGESSPIDYYAVTNTTLLAPPTGCNTRGLFPCVFPFVFNDVIYNRCTNALWSSYWCGTTPRVTTERDSWGECSLDCPGVECYTRDFVPCVFPFTFNDVVYNNCTTELWTFPWCGTVAHVPDDRSTGWGECTSSCPGFDLDEIAISCPQPAEPVCEPSPPPDYCPQPPTQRCADQDDFDCPCRPAPLVLSHTNKLCPVNAFSIGQGVCEACPPGKVNDAGDDAMGTPTSCTWIPCGNMPGDFVDADTALPTARYRLWPRSAKGNIPGTVRTLECRSLCARFYSWWINLRNGVSGLHRVELRCEVGGTWSVPSPPIEQDCTLAPEVVLRRLPKTLADMCSRLDASEDSEAGRGFVASVIRQMQTLYEPRAPVAPSENEVYP